MGLSWEVLDSWSRIAAIEPEWGQLLERSSANEPTVSPLWLRTWWQVFGGRHSRQLQLVCFRAGDRLVGLAPLVRRSARHWSGLQLRRIELMGSGEASRDTICSEYIGFVVERGLESEVCSLLVQLLTTNELGAWDELELARLNGDSPLLEPLRQALASAGQEHELSAHDTAYYISLPNSWEAYLSALRPSGRYLVKRSERELERASQGDCSIRTAKTGDELAIGISVLQHLHAARWSATTPSNEANSQALETLIPGKAPQQHRGAFASALFREFHNTAMRELFERGALQLSWLHMRGEPVAALYNISWNGKVYYYQSGRQPNLPRQLRPGIVLHAHAIRNAIARGCREYDFLGGDARFKRQLALAQRPITRLRATRPTSNTQLRRVADLCATEVRSAYRRFTTR